MIAHEIENKIKCLAENLIEIVQDGFTLLKNVIPKTIITDIKTCISDSLVKLGAPRDLPFADQYRELAKIKHAYETNTLVLRDMVAARFPQQMLLQPRVLELYRHILGSDLVYETTSELPVNVKDEKNDSLVKKWHQEFWSGTGYRTFSFWVPIIMAQGAGTMDMIRGSHIWGHVPHQNREPKWIPKDADIVNINCEEGDALVFSVLTLHRTVKNTVGCPRVAYTTTLRNPFEMFTGFDMMHGWEVLHLSAASKILKKCGNPHLSPFRTLGSQRTEISKY